MTSMTLRAPSPVESAPDRVAIACILASCQFLQLGAALATSLFPHAGTWATSSLRLVIAGAILLAVSRPAVWRWTPEQWGAAVVLGFSLGCMNGFYYAGIATVPLGAAVTIEFLGPLLLAAVLSRSLRDGVSVLLALTGMLLLGLDSYTGEPLDPVGVAVILLAGAFWALYILANKRTGALIPGQGGLAVALTVGGLITLPFGWQGVGTVVSTPRLVLIAVGTAVMASLFPAVLELIALRRLRPQVFSILISFEPAFAVLIGWLVLHQDASALKLGAVALVIFASVNQTVGGRRSARRASRAGVVEEEGKPRRWRRKGTTRAARAKSVTEQPS